MNNKMIPALYWLLTHAENGALRDGMDEEDRELAVKFLLASIGEATNESDPEQLAKIIHGKLEGAYHAGS